ncbi:hypothetical protein BSNK01_07600 [Bacillaceae bacterium]
MAKRNDKHKENRIDEELFLVPEPAGRYVCDTVEDGKLTLKDAIPVCPYTWEIEKKERGGAGEHRENRASLVRSIRNEKRKKFYLTWGKTFVILIVVGCENTRSWRNWQTR